MTGLHALLREHSPVNTARAPGAMEATGICCRCDWVWRAPGTYATHLAGVIHDAGYSPESAEQEPS